jgi:NAD(P)-dependent dehydrogenase (short-subunit alcohol dehydrogenase family)
MDNQKRSVVITGAASGIGRACALRFDRLGYRVLAGVRRPEDAEALKAASDGRIEPLTLEVTNQQSVTAAAAVLGDAPLHGLVLRDAPLHGLVLRDAPLHGLVNNAGIAVAGPVELVPLERWRTQLEINVIGLVSVTQAFLPALRRGCGRIVNIGSIAGRSALPCSGPYCASKYAVEAITDSLRMELAPFGIAVAVIEPGAVATPIWDKSARIAEEMSGQVDPSLYQLYSGLVDKIRKLAAQAGRGAIPVEEVVRAVEHALTSARPHTRYPVGRDAKLRLLLKRLPDRVMDRLIMCRISAST